MTYRPERMKFGIFLAPFHRLGENPTLAIDRDIELIEHLDRLGFDEAWIGEHHSAGWELIADPTLIIAAVAKTTRSIMLGTGVTTNVFGTERIFEKEQPVRFQILGQLYRQYWWHALVDVM